MTAAGALPSLRRLSGAGAVLLLLAACGVGSPARPAAGPDGPRARPPRVAEFESKEFVVAFAELGDTAEALAARYLGDRRKAWMIEDFNETTRFFPGQAVAIPKRAWNLSGVTPTGYQVVPVLVYHNIGPQARGRLVLGVKAFEEQMRYLKVGGYRVISLADLYQFVSLRRQLPRKAIVLTFDDGYKSFLQYAYPVLKELDFPATLFVYTDYIGVGRDALTWADLGALQAEGVDIQPHSKTHTDLRRRADESDEAFARRMQAELAQPRVLFERNLGRSGEMLAYPYGYYDDGVLDGVRAHGYVAGFDVGRQPNPSFARTLRIHRSQIYSEVSLEEFARSLTVFQEEPLK